MDQTLDYHKTCKDIHVAAKTTHIAVFHFLGDIRILEADSKEFDILFKKHPGNLVAVYYQCSLKIIQDDIL